jgi:hypothetical protein
MRSRQGSHVDGIVEYASQDLDRRSWIRSIHNRLPVERRSHLASQAPRPVATPRKPRESGCVGLPSKSTQVGALGCRILRFLWRNDSRCPCSLWASSFDLSRSSVTASRIWRVGNYLLCGLFRFHVHVAIFPEAPRVIASSISWGLSIIVLRNTGAVCGCCDTGSAPAASSDLRWAV